MPKPRVPTNILDARGAFNGKPGRRQERKGEPVVTEPLGGPPKHLRAAQRRAWRDIADTAPAGVLTGADRIAVERCAVLLEESRRSPATFNAAKETRLNSYLSRFGMTPSDRSRVKVASPLSPSDPWQEF